MAGMVDKRLFAELAEKRPEEVEMAPFCRYNEEERCYEVAAWNTRFAVFIGEELIEAREGAARAHDYFYVFLVNYLLSRKKPQPTGQWISEKDLVGGATFFRGPHAIPTEVITAAYGNDLTELRRTCERLGGTALDMADCAYGFKVVGSVCVALIYWLGDDDFPAEARLLIDSSIADSLALDVVFALLCDACVRIAGRE